MSSHSNEDDLVDRVLIGYTTLLQCMTTFHETDLSQPQRHKEPFDIRNEIPEGLFTISSELVQARNKQESQGSCGNIRNETSVILEGAKACQTLLSKRIEISRPDKLPDCPFTGSFMVSKKMSTQQASLVEKPTKCLFSVGDMEAKDNLGYERIGQRNSRLERREVFPDIEDHVCRQANMPKAARGICSLCPFKTSSAQDPIVKPSGCPLKFDNKGNIVRSDSVLSDLDRQNGTSSQPTSAAGSVPRCPIRSLDHHSPEEVAKYFEEHKRELPRSHEICVKRYQSNSDSIRKLDAKYGSLVNMIECLSAKHQPFLNNKNEEEQQENLAVGKIDAVGRWASEVDGKGINDPQGSEVDDKRESHFDRPLKDIRVGESPSRPWGFPVPVVDDVIIDEAHTQPTAAENTNIRNSLPHSESIKFADNVQTPTATCQRAPEGHARQIIFNGPVFIGYPHEQAAAFIRELGLSGHVSVP